MANNRHNHSIAIYYMLMKKNLRLGKYSSADICSQTFDPSLLTHRITEREGRITMEENKRNESVDLDRTTTAAGNRSTSRAVNRIHFIR